MSLLNPFFFFLTVANYNFLLEQAKFSYSIKILKNNSSSVLLNSVSEVKQPLRFTNKASNHVQETLVPQPTI